MYEVNITVADLTVTMFGKFEPIGRSGKSVNPSKTKQRRYIEMATKVSISGEIAFKSKGNKSIRRERAV